MADSEPSIRVVDRRTFPFAQIQKEFFLLFEDPFEFTVYGVLALYVNYRESTIKNLPVKVLARKSRMSERKVIESLASLEKKNIIQIKKRYLKQAGKRPAALPNEYRLMSLIPPEERQF